MVVKKCRTNCIIHFVSLRKSISYNS